MTGTEYSGGSVTIRAGRSWQAERSAPGTVMRWTHQPHCMSSGSRAAPLLPTSGLAASADSCDEVNSIVCMRVQVRRLVTKVVVSYWRINTYLRPEEVSQKHAT